MAYDLTVGHCETTKSCIGDVHTTDTLTWHLSEPSRPPIIGDDQTASAYQRQHQHLRRRPSINHLTHLLLIPVNYWLQTLTASRTVKPDRASQTTKLGTISDRLARRGRIAERKHCITLHCSALSTTRRNDAARASLHVSVHQLNWNLYPRDSLNNCMFS